MSLAVRQQSVNYRRYAWAANRITPEDMAKLYALKKQTRTPITVLVAQAVREYVEAN